MKTLGARGAQVSVAGVSGAVARSSDPFILWAFGRAFDFCFFAGIMLFLFIVPSVH